MYVAINRHNTCPTISKTMILFDKFMNQSTSSLKFFKFLKGEIMSKKNNFFGIIL